MNKCNAFLFLLLAAQLSFAQTQTKSNSIFDKQNELKIEVLKLLAVPTIEVAYFM